MAHRVTQETFDAAVEENVSTFDYTLEEAIENTVSEFEMQGADLSHIIKNLMLGGPKNSEVLVEALKRLKTLSKDLSNMAPRIHEDELKIIRTECDKGLEYRILGGKEGAYNIIIDVLLKFENNRDMCCLCFSTLTALMTQHPDLLNDYGVKLILSTIDKQKDTEVLRNLLKWVRECCVLHERNRQNIFDAGILEHIKPMLNDVNAELLRDCLAVLRALVLDDDIRVEFGRAHEHARVIASDTLCVIIKLLEKFKDNEVVMNDIMLTLTSLLVRTEFCKKVDDAGGIKILHDAMVTFQTKERIIKHCLKLIKALAGNDECKAHLVQNNMPKIIVESITANIKCVQCSINGMGAIAALTLRSPENSKLMFEAGAPNVIVDVLMQYPDNQHVVRNASWAVRNMVSRCRNQNPTFLQLGIESLLKNAMKNHKKCEYDIKAALRDLGCDVELKEAWTGKGGALTTQSVK